MITLRIDYKTKTAETWVVTTDTRIYRVTVARLTRERALDRQRRVLTSTLGEGVYRCLGNRRIGSSWFTEWTTV